MFFQSKFLHLFRYNEHALVYSGLFAAQNACAVQRKAAARVHIKSCFVSGTANVASAKAFARAIVGDAAVLRLYVKRVAAAVRDAACYVST